MGIQLPSLPEVNPTEWAASAYGELFSAEGNRFRIGLLERVKRIADIPSEDSFFAEFLVAQMVLLGFVSREVDSQVDRADSVAALLGTTGDSPEVQALLAWESEGAEALSETESSFAASAMGLSPWVSSVVSKI
jgi:hypothetical protein